MAELDIHDESEIEDAVKREVFNEAVLMLENKDSKNYREALSRLEWLGDWGNASTILEKCRLELLIMEEQEDLEKSEKAKEELYNGALKKLASNKSHSYNEAIQDLESLGNWRDAREIAERSKRDIHIIEKKEHEKKKEGKKRATIIAITTIILICIFSVIYVKVIQPNEKYKSALELYNDGKYKEAEIAFSELGDYKDSVEMIQKCEAEIEKKTELPGDAFWGADVNTVKTFADSFGKGKTEKDEYGFILNTYDADYLGYNCYIEWWVNDKSSLNKINVDIFFDSNLGVSFEEVNNRLVEKYGKINRIEDHPGSICNVWETADTIITLHDWKEGHASGWYWINFEQK